MFASLPFLANQLFTNCRSGANFNFACVFDFFFVLTERLPGDAELAPVFAALFPLCGGVRLARESGVRTLLSPCGDGVRVARAGE